MRQGIGNPGLFEGLVEPIDLTAEDLLGVPLVVVLGKELHDIHIELRGSIDGLVITASDAHVGTEFNHRGFFLESIGGSIGTVFVEDSADQTSGSGEVASPKLDFCIPIFCIIERYSRHICRSELWR